ncbi:hypothetical protein K6U06_11175 [Acidiferrimicrobium sp. IK]|uniref:hypothetical protein n=1 Tax=Acidiferrimicrobium sp. IK TaxID=2871700 RepID=UPI0021CB71AB|nr:hypothetical protein [Acidiferrimicrobium sp. IK]MCU4184923.1 hypothetical protein [Acidiferrimicrobium sp. IK]
MTLLFVGLGILVLAQILGIYALKTHKADLIFAMTMLGLFVGAAVCGGVGAYQQLR